MKAALIENGVVTALWEVPALDCYGDLYQLVAADESVRLGASWDGVKFTNLPDESPTSPQAVTMRQARLALLQAGKLSAVNSAIEAMPGAAGDAVRIEWEFSSVVERNRPYVQQIAVGLGLSDKQLDDLFTLAATL